MTGSLVAYLTVTIMIAGNSEPPTAESLKLVDLLSVVFAGLAVIHMGAIYWLRKILFFRRYEAQEFESPTAVVGAYFTASMVSWALAEAVAIYGMVLAVLAQDPIRYVAFMIPSAIALVLLRPQTKKLVSGYGEAAADSFADDGTW